MTIYECLGIGEFLIDETIPTDMIIENIDSTDLRHDADVFFRDIARVSIRASLNRGNHFMQVMEVELNIPDHINEISILIQKAIRYQVLFVFVYDDRYLILRRSFNLTISTEHVYTDHASFCTDWIYKENLEDDLVAMFDTEVVIDYYNEDYELSFQPKKTDSDNGDHRYFDDVISNAVRLNKSVIQSDVVCLRFLQDWIALHAVGIRVGIYDVLDRVRQVQAHQMIGNHFFVEKDCVRHAIGELEHSLYLISLDHTGKNPMVYYKGVRDLSTYADADALMLYILYDNNESLDDKYDEKSDVYDKQPREVKRYVDVTHYGVIASAPAYAASKLGFIDEIIRRYRLRGYHLLEDQSFRRSLVRRLRIKGYQVLEQFRETSIDTIGFLNSAMQVELILCMDKHGIRFEECTQDEYPSIHDYIKTHYTCTLCGEPLEGVYLTENKCLCPACKIRLEHLEAEKPFTVKSNSTEWDDDNLFTKLTVTFVLDESDFFDLPETLELTDAYAIISNDSLYRCDSFTLSSVDVDVEDDFLSEDSTLSIVWSSADYDFNSSNIKYIHLVFKEKNTGSFFLFIFKFNENGNLKRYDYIGKLDYSAYKAERAKQELNIILSTIQEDLCDRTSVETCLENIHLPEIKAVFEQNYIAENGIYYNQDKTCLIMCSENDYIESVVLPQSVETIGRGAFRGVKEIGSITFFNNLKKIAPTAFMGVAFRKDIVLPNSITEIGRRAFFRVKVPSDSINIPSMLETLGRHAFPLWWKLHYPNTGASLSDGVKEVLSTTNYEVVFGEEHQPTVIENGSNWEFSWELNSANELHITAHGDFAPYRWDSDKETEWRKYARRIKKLIFSSGITSVAGNAFVGCDNIDEVVFPHSLQYLDVSTLKQTRWYKNLDSEYSVVGDDCLIKVITDNYTMEIPNNIKYISRVTDSTLSEDKLSPNVRHIRFGNNVQTLLPFAFNGSAIETVLFNDGLVEIGQQALASCRELKFLCIPNSVKTIGYGAFSYSSSLECVVLPEKLETINHDAFDGCYWLEKIIIPFDKNEFKKKVQASFGRDDFPYNKCIYSTTVDNRSITKEYELVTRKRTKWESRPVTLSNHPIVKEPLARALRKYGIHTIEDLRKWGAKSVWEYVYKRERYPSLSFNSLIKLVLADEDISEINEERLVELYDFADSVTGYKLDRKLLKSKPNEESTGLNGLLNIGASMKTRLSSIGIKTFDDLMQTDIKIIWDKLYEKCSYTDCVEIWSLEGAKRGVLYADLDADIKAELKEYVDFRKGREKPNPEELTTLPNIGVGLAEKLKNIGISTSSALKAENTESIWDRLFAVYPSVGCYEMYAIEGAKIGIKMSNLDKSRKAEIREYVSKRTTE